MVGGNSSGSASFVDPWWGRSCSMSCSFRRYRGAIEHIWFSISQVPSLFWQKEAPLQQPTHVSALGVTQPNLSVNHSFSLIGWNEVEQVWDLADGHYCFVFMTASSSFLFTFICLLPFTCYCFILFPFRVCSHISVIETEWKHFYSRTIIQQKTECNLLLPHPVYSPISIIRNSIFRTLLLSEHIVLAMHKFRYSWLWILIV